jgi:hypothetical protein
MIDLFRGSNWRGSWKNPGGVVLIRPMLGAWEVPRIEEIVSSEQRRLVPLAVPGLAGDLHQDLGRGAMRVRISGSLSGDEARDQFLKDLREQFLAGEPVDFVADIVTESQLEQVLIEELDLEEVAGSADTFRFRIVLCEYTEPPEPPGFGEDFGLNVDAELGLDVDLGLDLLDLASLIPDLPVDVPKIGDLLSPLKPAAEGLKSTLGSAGSVLQPLDDLLG